VSYSSTAARTATSFLCAHSRPSAGPSKTRFGQGKEHVVQQEKNKRKSAEGTVEKVVGDSPQKYRHCLLI
jgi:hypothetical protein